MKIFKKTAFKENKQRGFSFIESILAVFMVSVGMIAVLSLISKNLKESIDSRDQITASLLAQEGIELVRNLRDNNWAQAKSTFEKGFPNSSMSKCSITYKEFAISCGGSSLDGTTLRLNIDKFFDYYSSVKQTKFRRKIMVSYDTNNKNTATSATIYSIVTWKNASNHTIVNPPNSDNCNSRNKCAFVKIVLTRWGGI